jgi:hypothetical protein
MINYIDDLKPKANKLLSFVADWQQASPEKIVELALSLDELTKEAHFPEPIQHFFNLSNFQELLANLKEGRFLPKPIVEKQEIFAYPPLEVQSIQKLVEAFHNLVHLDYNKAPINDPVTQVKVWASNISEYLLTLELFLPYKEKCTENILDFLFRSIRNFATEFKTLIKDNQNLFSIKLLELLQTSIFEKLDLLDSDHAYPDLIVDWYPVLTELTISPELAQYKLKSSTLASANAHKIINQLQTLLSKKSLFYQKNLPTYIPYDIRKEFSEWLSSLTDETETAGHKVNEFFTKKIWQEKYAIIESKQSCNNHKIQNLTHQFWPLRESLLSLTRQYGFFLPKGFNSYLLDVLQPFALGLNILGKPNHLAAQLTLGFYAIQYDYLSELLNDGAENRPKEEIKTALYELLPTIFSFFEVYYKNQPISSFCTIKRHLENLYPSEEALKTYSIKEIQKRSEALFELLIPSEQTSHDTITAFLHKIITRLVHISNLIPPRTCVSRLLLETIRKLEKIDFPSYSQSWYVFGETIGIIFILLSHLEDPHADRMRLYLDRCAPYHFFKILFSE